GLVLAIGIVVDDAIVVVENVERHIDEGQPPRDAAHAAMREVSGPIVTIASSTVISAFNSLTLSPALAAVLLPPRDAPPDRLTRAIDKLFGWLFRPWNRAFKRSSDRYESFTSHNLGRRGLVFVVYAALLAGAA